MVSECQVGDVAIWTDGFPHNVVSRTSNVSYLFQTREPIIISNGCKTSTGPATFPCCSDAMAMAAHSMGCLIVFRGGQGQSALRTRPQSRIPPAPLGIVGWPCPPQRDRLFAE